MNPSLHSQIFSISESFNQGRYCVASQCGNTIQGKPTLQTGWASNTPVQSFVFDVGGSNVEKCYLSVCSRYKFYFPTLFYVRRIKKLNFSYLYSYKKCNKIIYILKLVWKFCNPLYYNIYNCYGLRIHCVDDFNKKNIH